MTIIRGGEEVKIDDRPVRKADEVTETVAERPRLDEVPPDQSEKRVLQALIRLLIEKGYISLDDLKEKLSGK